MTLHNQSIGTPKATEILSLEAQHKKTIDEYKLHISTLTKQFEKSQSKVQESNSELKKCRVTQNLLERELASSKRVIETLKQEKTELADKLEMKKMSCRKLEHKLLFFAKGKGCNELDLVDCNVNKTERELDSIEATLRKKVEKLEPGRIKNAISECQSHRKTEEVEAENTEGGAHKTHHLLIIEKEQAVMNLEAVATELEECQVDNRRLRTRIEEMEVSEEYLKTQLESNNKHLKHREKYLLDENNRLERMAVKFSLEHETLETKTNEAVTALTAYKERHEGLYNDLKAENETHVEALRAVKETLTKMAADGNKQKLQLSLNEKVMGRYVKSMKELEDEAQKLKAQIARLEKELQKALLSSSKYQNESNSRQIQVKQLDSRIRLLEAQIQKQDQILLQSEEETTLKQKQLAAKLKEVKKLEASMEKLKAETDTKERIADAKYRQLETESEAKLQACIQELETQYSVAESLQKTRECMESALAKRLANAQESLQDATDARNELEKDFNKMERENDKLTGLLHAKVHHKSRKENRPRVCVSSTETTDTDDEVAVKTVGEKGAGWPGAGRNAGRQGADATLQQKFKQLVHVAQKHRALQN
eukprot:Platyproteum_vivax@DN6399_c0_g1_i1.p1